MIIKLAGSRGLEPLHCPVIVYNYLLIPNQYCTSTVDSLLIIIEDWLPSLSTV